MHLLRTLIPPVFVVGILLGRAALGQGYSPRGALELWTVRLDDTDPVDANRPQKTTDQKTPDDPLAELRERVERLEQAGASSTNGDAAKSKAKESSTDKKTTDSAAANAIKNAGSTKEGDDQEKWTVKLGGHVQMDYVTWAQADAAITDDRNYFEFRRLRLVADGTGYGVCDFRLQVTLEPETIGESPAGSVTSPDVKDAYFSMNEIPLLGRFRIGNFFVPFSLEQVTNDTNNLFLERSIPTQGVFSADREVGMALYNCTEDKRITWTYGIFIDSISEATKERIDDNQGYRLSGRWTWLPYYHEASKGRYLFYTGVGILHTHDFDGRVRVRTRPQVHEGPRLIDSGILDANEFTTTNVELATVLGPLAVQAEAFGSTINQTTAISALTYGAYVHTSYFLTGENRIFEPFGQHGPQFARNVPYCNFRLKPCCIQPGAWEAKLRWSFLSLSEVNAGQYNDVTGGMNWYWSDRTRIMFDWIHPFTSSETVFGSTQADLLGMRFDFNW